MPRSYRRLAFMAVALGLTALLTGPASAQTATTGNDVIPRTRSDPGGSVGGPGSVVMERATPSPRATTPRAGPAQRSGSTTTGSLGDGTTEATGTGASRSGDEVARTALLNRFGGLGFAGLDGFRRTGTGYEADVRTVTGERMTVDIDPRTGAVTTRR